jgi:hypothetical protein
MRIFWAQRSRWLCAWGVVAVLGAAGAVRAQGVSGPQVKGRTAIAGGDVASTWSAQGATMKVAGPAGMTPLLSYLIKGGGSWSIHDGANLPLVEPGGGVRHSIATGAAQRYASSGRSVYSEALAVGFTSKQAAATATALGVRGPSATATRPVLSSGCEMVTRLRVTVQECLVARLLSASGADWKVGFATYADATPEAGQQLAQFAGYTTVSQANNALAKSSPTAALHLSSCTPETASTAGLSVGATICPTSWGPYVAGKAAFGSIWRGCDAGGTVENAPSVSELTDPDGAQDTVGMRVIVKGGC